ncbi:5-oxoprolinase subunit PxpB [Mangrovibacterium diazotrophicum]|uniref:KipI family sensor histidine kinase inhibitor n=1 Tax=Mangrovibacterium diazotrophicum TaxID=1261403 RepID=A0A419W4U7_9BACT|nr:5-oxoprolinase subunit PxpB [Mangrovibacterium diazotrophicum]RKD90450.1 KipI family sensor histidine kinase inhibitor [Mangrovibacterium diazotrophicum]
MISYFPLGDSAIQLTFGDSINEETNRKIYAYMRILKEFEIPGIIELVPSYTKLIVHYNPLEIGIHELVDKLKELEQQGITPAESEMKIVEIPVLYGPTFGSDLEVVLQHTGLTEEELITQHSAPIYKVYMLGFTPGFCYLGGMPALLATPRKKTPSAKIRAGSVGIAGEQTGVYPIESPGGWQIIGRTPLKLFNPEREQPFLVEAGNSIRFYPISQTEFDQLNEYDA